MRGSKEKRILLNHHDQLSTYGIGKDRSPDEWKMIARSLIHQGLLDEATDGYSVLQLNDLSWDVLKGLRKVLVAIETQKETTTVIRADTDNAQVEELLTKLKALRKELADKQVVPPYVIFSNATLRLMAQQQPVTRSQFLSLSGVGDRKMSQYGEAFMGEITAFREDNGLSVAGATVGTTKIITPLKTETRTHVTATHLDTLGLHQQGLRIDDIAEQRDLRRGTVMSHLELLLENGYTVELDRLVSRDRSAQILQAFNQTKLDSLTAIREIVGETVSFDEIRLVRAWWRRKK